MSNASQFDRDCTDPRAVPPHQDGTQYRNTSGSITDLFQQIVGNVQSIIRSEVRRARAEVREEARTAGRAAATLGAGAVLGLYALGFLLLTLVYARDHAMPNWLAALIVAGAVGLVSAVLLKLGLNRLKQVSPVPEQTIDTIKEDVRWVRNSRPDQGSDRDRAPGTGRQPRASRA